MGLYEKVGEFTPDSLFASPDYPVLKEGIGLKKGQGVLKRGSLIVKTNTLILPEQPFLPLL